MNKWWELYAASIPDGADLVASRATPGWVRGFFRTADGIGGHAEFSKVDVRRPIVIGLAATVFATVAVIKSKPRIRQWRENEVVPTDQTVWSRVIRQDGVPNQSAVTELARTAVEDFSSDVDVALADARTSMSSDEAQRHLLEILMAASIIADRMRTLSNAHIKDFPKLTAATKTLTTRHVTDTINRLLEANMSLLDDETSARLANIPNGGLVADGRYVPLNNESVKEALRLLVIQLPCPSDVSNETSARHDAEQPQDKAENDV